MSEQAFSSDIEVEDTGAPQLEPETTEGEPQATTAAQPQLVAAGWTPEEAEQFLSVIWNVGCLVWGIEWAARKGEMDGFKSQAAPLLDKVLPKGVGGVVGTGVAVLQVAGGLVGMGIARKDLIRGGPEKPKPLPAPAAAAADSAPRAAAAAGPFAQSQKFKFPPDLAVVVGQPEEESRG